MIYKIFICLAGIFGIVYLTKTYDRFARIILIIMILAIGVTMIPGQQFMAAGMQVYMISLGLTIIYGMINSSFSKKKKFTIVLAASLLLLTHFWKMNHFPGAFKIGIGLIVPLIWILYSLIKNRKKFKNELGILVIMATDCLIELLLRIN